MIMFCLFGGISALPLLRSLGFARCSAESNLLSAETTQGFPVCLLALLASPTVPPTTRQSAVLYFKNFIKRHYAHGDSAIPPKDRDQIKARVVDLMTTVPPQIQAQLAESVGIIADSDFPDHWQTLVPSLVSKLGVAPDLAVWQGNLGVLRTAHSIFARWRSAIRTDSLMLEIKHVLEHFCTPYLLLFQACEQAIDANPPLPTMKVLFEDLLLLLQIFYDLNCQDIPEFFEDNMPEFMRIMRKFLLYKNAALEGPPRSDDDEDGDDDDEEDPVTKVKTAICENIDLYAKRYEDVFTELRDFVESVWGLLTTVGRSPRYDGVGLMRRLARRRDNTVVNLPLPLFNPQLVSKAIAFLTSVARPARHKDLFAAPEVLQSIIERIVLPNIALRPGDVNEFEDEPMSYLRREIEGTDADSRRGAATEFVRGLMEHFEAQVTGACGRYIEASLANYERDKRANWKEKDTALYLIMALGAKSVSERVGCLKGMTRGSSLSCGLLTSFRSQPTGWRNQSQSLPAVPPSPHLDRPPGPANPSRRPNHPPSNQSRRPQIRLPLPLPTRQIPAPLPPTQPDCTPRKPECSGLQLRRLRA